ncbi:unnamed protein product [Pylaiella littoralis]
MIRNVLVMKSGLVLFSREFANTVQQPRLLGSLLTAMVEFSKVAAGMQVAYVELTAVSVTLVGNDATNTFCALFHDREDGATFGRLIASELLNAFLEEHSKDIEEASSLNLKDFRAFKHRIPGIVRKSVQPVLGKLVHVKGILRCALVTETSETFQTAEIDQLGLLANLQALISLSTDIMAQAGNGCVSMSLESSSNSRILVWRIHVWTLVIAVHKSANRNRYQKHIDEALGVLEKVLELTTSLGNLVAR